MSEAPDLARYGDLFVREGIGALAGASGDAEPLPRLLESTAE